MAFATAKTKTVTEVTGVDLSLTKAEAETLVTVLRNVGGDRYNGPRVHTDAILGHLKAVKITPADLRVSGAILIDKLAAKAPFQFDTFSPDGANW